MPHWANGGNYASFKISYVFLEIFFKESNSECVNWKVKIIFPPSHCYSSGIKTTIETVITYLYTCKCIANWFGFGVGCYWVGET